MIQRLLRAAVGRVPGGRTLARRSADSLMRVALAPFGRQRPRGTPAESAALVARTDDLNRAAELYFQTYPGRAFLLEKPFGDREYFGRHLFSLGVLVEALRLHPADVVAEFGAGPCWVSHFLNRFGCRTIAVDVSETALGIGRERFERDPATRWDRQPEFLAYDGHHLPVADATCDKVVIYDAFHHVPNQRAILTELCRILKPNGIVAMSEPGTGHAGSESSRRDVERYGVLENELVIEDVAALARTCGFREARLVVASSGALWQIPADDLGGFVRGKGLLEYWEHLASTLVTGHYLLLFKGDPRPTTRRPEGLGARIAILAPTTGGASVHVGQRLPVSIAVTNTGDTRWLAADVDDGGWTRLGAHLFEVGPDGRAAPAEHEWLRAALPTDVGPGETVTLAFDLPALSAAATYRVDFDMVIEHQLWFSERGSAVVSLAITVGDGKH